MATLTEVPGITTGYSIQWYEGKRRRTIYIGGKRFSKKTAVRLKEAVESLLYYRDNGITVPDKSLAYWLETVHETIRQKLGNAGLLTVCTKHTCAELWAEFLKQKTDIKETSLKTYKLAQCWFLKFFSENESVSAITKERLVEYKTMLLKHLAPATVSGMLKKTSPVLDWAVDKEWLPKNPLNGIPKGSQVNRSKDRIITMDEYRRLLDACPCQEWRVIIALARIGGLRCPSELIPLRWADVNWEHNRIFIRSPKTEHHAGKESRMVPLFPDLRKELETLFFNAENEGREFVVNLDKNTREHLGVPFGKISRLAGIGDVRRPFDNMRMSRSNEVLREFGGDLESAWIGHSSAVRKAHYFMVSDEDFVRACQDVSTAKIDAVGQKTWQNNGARKNMIMCSEVR